MKRTPKALAAVLTCFFLTFTPAATAYWAARGSVEPESRQDVEHDSMFLQPYTDGTNGQVYFNAFRPAVAGANPNVALLATNVYGFATTYQAMLGIWRDCNKDNYVGSLENVAWEYPSALLATDELLSTCLPDKTYAGQVNNDGEWVREFIPIGPACSVKEQWDGVPAADCEASARTIVDTMARVWGDNGLPGEPVDIDCPVLYLPRGTIQTTGGIVRYGECQLVAGLGQALGVSPTVTSCTPASPDVDICEYENPYSTGPEESQTALVFDCTTIYTLNDPLTGRPLYYVPGPDLGSISTQSINPAGNGQGTTAHFGSCGGAPPSTYDLYKVVESSPTELSRRSTDWEFVYYEGTPRPTDVSIKPSLSDVSTRVLGVYNASGGANWALAQVDYFPMWIATRTDPVWTSPYWNIEDLTGLGIAPRRFATFYAHVGPTTNATGALRPAVGGFYGAEWCGGDVTNTINGFDCDQSHWYLVNGASVAQPYHVRAGEPYQLRDIDCFDGSIWTLGPGVSPTMLSEDGPCERPDPMMLQILAGADGDLDCLADQWQTSFGAFAPILRVAGDPDSDEASNLLEFQWRTIPVGVDVPVADGTFLPGIKDYDRDGLNDGPEIAYWNVDPSPACLADRRTAGLVSTIGTWPVALFDEDSFIDLDGDGEGGPRDADSDRDGLADSEDFALETFLESRDSDCALNSAYCNGSRPPHRYLGPSSTVPGDQLDDKAERDAWLTSPWGANGYLSNVDGDRITNNLLDADSDGDELPDGGEWLGNVTRMWSFDTDQDRFLDGGDITLAQTDARFAIFEAASICYTTQGTGRTYLGEAGTQGPGRPDVRDLTCEDQPEPEDPAAFWDVYYGGNNYDIPEHELEPKVREYLTNGRFDTSGTAERTGRLVTNLTSEEIAAKTATRLNRVLASTPVAPIRDDVAALTNASTKMVEGVLSCAGSAQPPRVSGELIQDLSGGVACSTSTVSPYLAWLTEQTLENAGALTSTVVNRTSFASLLAADGTRAVESLVHDTSSQPIEWALRNKPLTPVDIAGAANSSFTRGPPSTAARLAAVSVQPTTPRHAHPALAYSIVSQADLGLGVFWPAVQAANRAAQGTTGGIVNPIGTVDSLAYSVYASSTQGPRFAQAALSSPSTIDLDNDGLTDLRIDFTVTTEVVSTAEGSASGIRVTPTVTVKKTNAASVFNATVMVYTQVTNTNYVVGLGYDSLGVDAPDEWRATLTGFDAFETQSRTLAFTATHLDPRGSVPLHVMLGGFQVDTSDAEKDAIPGRESTAEVESMLFPPSIEHTLARDYSQRDSSTLTITLPRASQLVATFQDEGTDIHANYSATLNAAAGRTRVSAIGSADQLQSSVSVATSTPSVKWSFIEKIGVHRRAFDLDASNLVPPTDAFRLASIEISGTAASFNYSANAAAVSLQHSEGSHSCKAPTSQHFISFEPGTTTDCLALNVPDVSYLAFSPLSLTGGRTLTDLRIATPQGLDALTVSIRAPDSLTLTASRIGTSFQLTHEVHPNGTRRALWSTTETLPALDAWLDSRPRGGDQVGHTLTNANGRSDIWVSASTRDVKVASTTGADSATLEITNSGFVPVARDSTKRPLATVSNSVFETNLSYGDIRELRAAVETDGAISLVGSFAAKGTYEIAFRTNETDLVGEIKPRVGPLNLRLGPSSDAVAFTLGLESSGGMDGLNLTGRLPSGAVQVNMEATGPRGSILLAPAEGRTEAHFSAPTGAAYLAWSSTSGLPTLDQRGSILRQDANVRAGGLWATDFSDASTAIGPTGANMSVSGTASNPMHIGLETEGNHARLQLDQTPQAIRITRGASAFEWTTTSTSPLSGEFEHSTSNTLSGTRVTQLSAGHTINWTESASLSVTFTTPGETPPAESGAWSYSRPTQGSGAAAWNTSVTSPGRHVEVYNTPTSLGITSTDGSDRPFATGTVRLARSIGDDSFVSFTGPQPQYAISRSSSSRSGATARITQVEEFSAVLDVSPAGSSGAIARKGTAAQESLATEITLETSSSAHATSTLPTSASWRLSKPPEGTPGFAHEVTLGEPAGASESHLLDAGRWTIASHRDATPTTFHATWVDGTDFDLTSSSPALWSVIAGAEDELSAWPVDGQDALHLDAPGSIAAGRLDGYTMVRARPGNVSWERPGGAAGTLSMSISANAGLDEMRVQPIAPQNSLEWNGASREVIIVSTGSTSQLGVRSETSLARLALLAESIPPGSTKITAASPGRMTLTAPGAITSIRFATGPGTATLELPVEPGITIQPAGEGESATLYATGIASLDAFTPSGRPGRLELSAGASTPLAVRLDSGAGVSYANGTFTGTAVIEWPDLRGATTPSTASFSVSGMVAGTPFAGSATDAARRFDLTFTGAPTSTGVHVTPARNFTWTRDVSSATSGARALLATGDRLWHAEAPSIPPSLSGQINSTATEGTLTANTPTQLWLAWNPAAGTEPAVDFEGHALSIRTGISPTVFADVPDVSEVTWRASPGPELLSVNIAAAQPTTTPAVVHVVSSDMQARIHYPAGLPTDAFASVGTLGGSLLPTLRGPAARADLTLNTQALTLSMSATPTSATAITYEPDAVSPEPAFTVVGAASQLSFDTDWGGSYLRMAAEAAPSELRLTSTADVSSGVFSTNGTGTASQVSVAWVPQADSAALKGTRGSDHLFVTTTSASDGLNLSARNVSKISWTKDAVSEALKREGTAAARNFIYAHESDAGSTSLLVSGAGANWGWDSRTEPGVAAHWFNHSETAATVTAYSYATAGSEGSWFQANVASTPISVSFTQGDNAQLTFAGTASALIARGDVRGTVIYTDVALPRDITMKGTRSPCQGVQGRPGVSLAAASVASGRGIFMVGDNSRVPVNSAGDEVVISCNGGLGVLVDLAQLGLTDLTPTACGGVTAKGVPIPVSEAVRMQGIPVWNGTVSAWIQPDHSTGMAIAKLTADCEEGAAHLAYELKTGATDVRAKALEVQYVWDGTRGPCGAMTFADSCIKSLRLEGIDVGSTADIVFKGETMRKGMQLKGTASGKVDVNIVTETVDPRVELTLDMPVDRLKANWSDGVVTDVPQPQDHPNRAIIRSGTDGTSVVAALTDHTDGLLLINGNDDFTDLNAKVRLSSPNQRPFLASIGVSGCGRMDIDVASLPREIELTAEARDLAVRCSGASAPSSWDGGGQCGPLVGVKNGTMFNLRMPVASETISRVSWTHTLSCRGVSGFVDAYEIPPGGMEVRARLASSGWMNATTVSSTPFGRVEAGWEFDEDRNAVFSLALDSPVPDTRFQWDFDGVGESGRRFVYCDTSSGGDLEFLSGSLAFRWKTLGFGILGGKYACQDGQIDWAVVQSGDGPLGAPLPTMDFEKEGIIRPAYVDAMPLEIFLMGEWWSVPF